MKKGKLDVTDKEGMAKFLLKVDAETPVECVRVSVSSPTLHPTPDAPLLRAAAQLRHRQCRRV